MHNHYFNQEHTLRPYTHSLVAMPGTIAPANALRGEKPVVMPGFWPGEKGGAWVSIEDHRGEKGYVHGKPQILSDLGPYPAGWSVTPPPPTQAELLAGFVSAIQRRLDDFAHTRNYDSILSAATYATSTVPTFAAEGRYAVDARDATWATGYSIMDDVLSAKRPMPTIEEVLAELPILAWPG